MVRRPDLRRDMSIWRRLDIASRYAWPGSVLLLGLLLVGVPLGLPGLAVLRAAYVMGSVFFWSLYRPVSVPAPFVAGVGLLVDLLGLSPLGMWAVLLLLLQACVLAARRRLITQSFLLTWASFAALAAILSGLGWVMQSALELHALPLLPLLVQVLVACLVYPALAGLFIGAHRGAAAAELA